MLIDRMRPENTNGTTYHYCSAQTLLSILRCRTLRFSDVTLLNDGEEGAWGYSVFLRAVEFLSDPGNIPEGYPTIPEPFFEEVRQGWLVVSNVTRHMVACFSSDGDSLSQWRAYADDGRGFSIGFDAGILRSSLPIQMYDILYDPDQQLREMVRALGSIHLEFADNNHDYSSDWFKEAMFQLTASSVAFKNPAWRDECEIRCHHMVLADLSDHKWELIDPGGRVGDGAAVAQPIQFEARNGLLVPFIDFPFPLLPKAANCRNRCGAKVRHRRGHTAFPTWKRRVWRYYGSKRRGSVPQMTRLALTPS